ncbi:hypothetical protein C8R43DRAFT_1108197 [Mycena crocata]|nr:hypothetical protein C8R43DRAFT_1108197 [Mycena crocata]
MSLERLIISDQPRAKYTLVTDTLLSGLILTSDSDQTPSFVPHLNYIARSSLFKFSAQVYLDFITSRIVPGMARFPSVLRQFDSTVHQKLLDLVGTGALKFQLEEDIEEE